MERSLSLTGEYQRLCSRIPTHDFGSLLAFAQAAKIYGWNRPKMTDQPICKILQ